MDDLRVRLDQADADRPQAFDRLAMAQERISALLTDHLLGDGLRSQTDGRQASEVAIAADVLNRIVELGRPGYVRIIAAVRSTLTSKQPDRLNQAA